MKSRFAIHLIDSTYNFDRDSVNLIHEENNERKRVSLETIEILKG